MQFLCIPSSDEGTSKLIANNPNTWAEVFFHWSGYSIAAHLSQ